ncbi:hypothetical protein PAMC26510_13855 [Caballeronia sordidicola]|uniref:Uncharacterized protein n=1 Tax=Caballeronia sordidicola TaxID=196367 RepID=A0A242MHD1_CABSO|nr:hypothetical protein PAMC26577_26605 [Caballeronia sordidicola]OTP75521.1 hypothetical protein PAMC26510_13855 [Caballeronia sordidicola]
MQLGVVPASRPAASRSREMNRSACTAHQISGHAWMKAGS